MKIRGSNFAPLTLALATAAFPAAVAAAEEGPPLYLWPDPYPFQTVDAATDEAYRPGDLAVVAGKWQRGGLPGGAILLCAVNEPVLADKKRLAAPPFEVRYFYVDVLPEGVEAEGAVAFASARGLVAADDLYEYAYILRPEKFEWREAPAWELEDIRETLSALRKRIKKLKLNEITPEAHWPHNKKYKIS
ncbi:MAG: hypothetical protein JSU81_03810, partial [Candidatus Coatesbacteria bacterium]